MRLWHYAVTPQTMGNYSKWHLYIKTFVLRGKVSLSAFIFIYNTLKYSNVSVPSN